MSYQDKSILFIFTQKITIMQKCYTYSVILLLLTSCVQNPSQEKSDQSNETHFKYDSTLATEYGADEYGMKQYVMAFLKRGPNRSQDSATASNLQRAHLENITRLANNGKLVLAGPFIDDGDIRGIYIFNVKTIKEARLLTATDPAIEAGRLVMELHPWYGSAALMNVNELHKKISKKEI